MTAREQEIYQFKAAVLARLEQQKPGAAGEQETLMHFYIGLCGHKFQLMRGGTGEEPAPPAAPEPGKSRGEERWLCPYCFTLYAEYVNGCPRCHMGEVGTSTSVIRVDCTKTPNGWIIAEPRIIEAIRTDREESIAAAAGAARRKALSDTIDAARHALGKFPIDAYLSVFEAIKSLDAAAAPAGEEKTR